jgi:SWI/SNF-related matrix-associated actin-dependent regulator of chromatin subfamily A-like protein 1
MGGKLSEPANKMPNKVKNSIPNPTSFRLKPFQKIGVWTGIHRFKGRMLLADEPGLGKTCQSLFIADHFRQNGPIVVVCPASVKYQWEIEVHKTLGYQTWVLNGLKPPKKMPLYIPPVIVLNWDILRGDWTDRLIELHPLVVIGDECPAIKSFKAQRTRAFQHLCRKVPHVILLSGAPIENGPIEFFPALNLLRPDHFKSFRSFCFRYSIPRVTPWGMKFEGSANEGELHKLVVETCMLRRTKSEVMKQLPPVQRTMVPLKIDRKEYKYAENNFLSWLFKQNPGKAMRVKNAVHIAKLTYLLGLIAKLKTKAVKEWIKEFLESTGEKLVVFAHHRAILESLHRDFSDSVLVYGGLNIKKRQERIDQFADDPSTKVFFGSITATGMGINRLQTVCNTLAIVELVWNPAKIIQVEDRLHRIGQRRPVTAHYLMAKDTLDSLLCKVIQRKQKAIRAIVDGKSGSTEFKILDEVFQQLKQGKY